MFGGRPQVVVVGGANMDICGRATNSLLAYDSNLGLVRTTHGGVGRNISHNLALLGVTVSLIAPFGDDRAGKELMDGCHKLGIDTSASVVVEGAASSSYLFITDAAGEMQLAINDMAILDELTDARLAERLELMNSADIVVLDANLSEATLEWLAAHITAPIFSDPISCAKAARLKAVLPHIHTLKPNAYELETLSNKPARELPDVKQASTSLLKRGVKRLFVSRGEQGLFVADNTQELVLQPASSEVVSTTGAGDAMMAALIWAELQGANLEQAARLGMAAAELCSRSEYTVNPQMSATALISHMGEHTARLIEERT
ncbi:MAG: carbohydrate kinase family protein [Atopobiaceae bacterium]|nr:carbohydrate kinase family protein [Atopobiaceae bacterium]